MINLLWMMRKRKAHHLIEHNILVRIKAMAAYFAVIAAVHVAAMLVIEGMSLGDALWVTFTTVTTVGYGDLSAQTTWGRIATVILLYVGGIFILAKIAGDYFEYRSERKEKMLKGHWRWDMRDHIIIINAPSHNGEQYFLRLISQFRENPDFRDIPIQLLTRTFTAGLPESLRKLDVVHFTGSPDVADSLRAVDIADAAHIIVLAVDEYDRLSDSLTFDILHRLREFGAQCKILAECLDDGNRERFLRAGASTVLRPIRAYPELIVRAVVAPGTEQVMENMFTHGGGHTRRYDVDLTDVSWSEIACALITKGLGTAMAYLDLSDKVVCNPDPARRVSARGLIIMVREDRIPTGEEVRDALLG